MITSPWHIALYLIAVVVCSSGAKLDFPITNSKRILHTTSQVLVDIFETRRKLSVMRCSVKLIFDTQLTSLVKGENKLVTSFNWVNIHFPDELLIYYYQGGNISLHENTFYSSPASKFFSSCWFTIFFLTAAKHPWKESVGDVATIGNPNFDFFIAVSLSKKTLIHFLSPDGILTSVVWKLGINPQVDENGAFLRMTYLVEPKVFNGKIDESVSHEAATLAVRPNNLNGHTFSCAYFNFPPYVVTFPNTPNGIDGVSFRLIQEISRGTNATFVFYSSANTRKGFGIYSENNQTWGPGLIQEIILSRADVIPLVAPSVQRIPYISFTTASTANTLVLCLQSPHSIRHWQSLIHPLDSTVWFAAFLTYIFVTTVYSIKLCLQQRVFTALDGGKKAITLIDTSLSLFFSIMLEQTAHLPHPTISRVMVILWITFCYLLGTAYKSNLVAYLTFLDKQIVPPSFEDLSRFAPHYGIMLHTVGGIEIDLLIKSTNPLMKSIGRRAKITKNILECLRFGSQDMSVCIGWRGSMTNALAQNSESNPKFKSMFIPNKHGGIALGCIGLPKGSIFWEVINRYVGIARAGFLPDLWQRQFYQKVKLQAKRDYKAEHALNFHKGKTEGRTPKDGLDHVPQPLSFGNLAIVFSLIILGDMISLIAFFLELYKIIYIKMAKLINFCQSCEMSCE